MPVIEASTDPVSVLATIHSSPTSAKIGSRSLRPRPVTPALRTLLEALAKTQPKKNLCKLYQTAWTNIPAVILSRSPPHMTQPDLAQVLDYKLTFGQNRPALRGMIGKLRDEDVREASETSFKLLAQAETSTSADEQESMILDAMGALTVLKGVGPATASLVLSLLSPSTPFFSDEAAVRILQPAAGRKGLKYSEGEYRRFVKRVGEQAGMGRQRSWERRVWMEEVAREKGIGLAEEGSEGKDRSGIGKKRKAEDEGAE